MGLTTYDAKDPDTAFPPITQLRPPKGAPNVLIVLIDDCGFGAASAFGGPIATPNAERLAANGLKFNRFHTTALCSPTRQALLTGRNHHSVNMGAICEIATSAPGYTSVLPKDKAPLAMTLKLNGYSTAQFGKCHEVPVWETSPLGPFNQWPTGGGGFEYFYGFIGGETNQWYPAIYEGTTPMEQDKSPEEGYHFTDDMTTKAIGWVRQQKALMPDKPFFMYYAPGATHAPHHVPEEWTEKYKGKFDGGWDKLREETFARQKKLGVIPADAALTERPDEIPAWDEMPAELKPILLREMEVYAGFLEHTDHHLGRLVDTLEELEILDDTLVYYIIGDNGASAEGTVNGCFNEVAVLNGMSALETPEFLMSKIDDFGGPDAYNHYAVGWAHAMDTPYQWTKQVASHFGGTRNGTIVHWPNGIDAKGEIRAQFHHVIDIAPTILEAAKLPAPTIVNSVQQAPYEGTSMLYAFNDAQASDRHETQYFEIFCNRGIYHKGWTAVTRHGIPWLGSYERAFEDDVWELYDTNTDWTQAHDLAQEMPDKLRELQRLFLIEATKYHVLPLDDRMFERFNPDLAGRPQLIGGDSQILFGGMSRLSEGSLVVTKNKSYSLTAEIEVPQSGASGVIAALGGSVGGWSLYAHNGRLKHCYNFFGIERFSAESTQPIPAGKHQVRMEFAYDGGGLAKGGDVSLYVDGKKDGQGRVEHTVPMLFSADETCDVGKETGSAVSPDYGPTGNEFNGRVNWVQIDLEKDDHDHLITPEERFRIAMTRQ
ncbi:MAG TPA: arylsulfatase [Gaiellales bacterium]|nr:arylsulfatase [Gaiellales bacterium]